MGRIWNQFYKLRLIWRRCLARNQGVKLGKNVRLASGVDFNLGRGFKKSLKPSSINGRIELGESAWLEQGVVLWAFDGIIKVYNNVYMGPYVTIYGHGGVDIGENTLISMKATILSSNHGVPSLGESIREQADVLLPTKIGRDVWIGANAVILGGVTVNDGAVIAAGAVVTKDVEPGAIVAGVPAKTLRMRGSEGSWR